MHMELTASPYILNLSLDPAIGCCGTIVRLPDGIEASFNHCDALLVLLEAMGGRRWWQVHCDELTAQLEGIAQIER